MKVRAVDNNNDWTFGKGQNDYKSDLAGVAQNAKCRLQCFLGDNYFNLSGGIDWFNLVGSKDFLRLRMEISNCLRNTYGVSRLIGVQVIVDDDRNFTISYSLDTIYGELTNQNFEVPSGQ